MSECIHLLDPAVCADCRSIPGYSEPTDLTECRSCGAEIIWCTTSSGKRMPVDAEPGRRGNIAVEVDGHGHAIAHMVKADARAAELEAGRLHESHFATCEQAEGWRK